MRKYRIVEYGNGSFSPEYSDNTWSEGKEKWHPIQSMLKTKTVFIPTWSAHYSTFEEAKEAIKQNKIQYQALLKSQEIVKIYDESEIFN